MPKPSLLHASPFPPQESGISDYSVALTLALSEHFDITLYSDPSPISDPRLARFPVVRHGVDEIQFDRYEHRLYQIGNQPWFHGYIYEACLMHPGLVVLHEPVLYYLTVGIYRDRPDFYSRLFRIGGPVAVSIIKRQLKEGRDLLQFREPHTLPLNRELLESGNDIMVHSERSGREVTDAAGPGLRVHKINHLLISPSFIPTRSRQEVFGELGIPPDATVIASFGHVAPTKLNHVVCRVVRRLNEARPDGVYYLIVGPGNYIDPYLGKYVKMTGYISIDQFEEYLECCDLVVNLRYPSMGETSGALIRAMQAGKPCIVTDIGWFSELPDDAVLKLDVDRGDGLIERQLYEALDIFMDHPEPFVRMAEVGAEYARTQHAPARVAAEIYGALCGSRKTLFTSPLRAAVAREQAERVASGTD